MCSMNDDPSTYKTTSGRELSDNDIEELHDQIDIALPVFNRHASIGEPPYEVLQTQCKNPNCACKGPSFR